MHLDPDLHPDERDTKQTNIGRTNIENGDPSTQKAPKGAINSRDRVGIICAQEHWQSPSELGDTVFQS